MTEKPRWLEISMSALAIIGLLAVLAGGAFGVRALFAGRRDAGAIGELAAAGIQPQNDSAGPQPAAVPQPPPGFAVTAVPQPPSPLPAPAAAPSRTVTSGDSAPRTAVGGIPDLAVAIVDTGVMVGGGESAEFRHTDAVRASDQPAIVFDVSNAGSAVSEPWSFSATLPTFAGRFTSETQPRLAPGERIRFTLTFRPIDRSAAAVAVITVDPQNALRDKNRLNDVATTTFILIP